MTFVLIHMIKLILAYRTLLAAICIFEQRAMFSFIPATTTTTTPTSICAYNGVITAVLTATTPNVHDKEDIQTVEAIYNMLKKTLRRRDGIRRLAGIYGCVCSLCE